jgi:hypothetical protein
MAMWIRRLARSGAALVAVSLHASCYPTVTLGSNDGAGTTEASAATDGDATETDGVGTTEAAGSSTGGSAISTGNACELPGEGSACIACANEACCAEVEFCMMQPECDCFLDCLSSEPSGICQTACGVASGVAAVVVCLGMQCAAECEA